jgi:hypothetical protein
MTPLRLTIWSLLLNHHQRYLIKDKPADSDLMIKSTSYKCIVHAGVNSRYIVKWIWCELLPAVPVRFTFPFSLSWLQALASLLRAGFLTLLLLSKIIELIFTIRILGIVWDN